MRVNHLFRVLEEFVEFYAVFFFWAFVGGVGAATFDSSGWVWVVFAVFVGVDVL